MLSSNKIRHFLETAVREKSTRISVVPSYLHWILEFEDLQSYDLSSIDTIVYSSAPMPRSLINAAVEKLHCKFIQGYGMTEMGIISLLMPEDHLATNESDQNKRLYSVGRPMPGVEIRVVDSYGEPCEVGNTGEIIAKSPAMMKGYCNLPEETAKVIHDGWYYSGDIGYFDEQNFLHLVDRKKDILISGGENISPKEVETCIYTMKDDVKTVAVVGIPDGRWGETVAAFVVKHARSSIKEEDIQQYCKEHPASYMKPRYVIFIDEMPINENGKIKKNILKDCLMKELTEMRLLPN